MFRAAPVLALLLCSACATAPFKVQVTHVGNYDPERDEAVAERAKALPWDRQYAVELLMNQVPQGLKLDQGKLSVEPGFEARYRVLGTMRSAQEYNATAAAALSAFWYIDMHEQHSRARDVFCKVQTPLRTLTLGIWWLFSPTSWPCWVTYSLDAADNERIHAQELRRLAVAMGANLVVVSGSRDRFNVDVGYYGGSSYTVESAALEAFAIVDSEKPIPTP